MKAASVQDVNANASKGATLNEMLFNLLSTLAWSANRRGDQTDKHTRWLTAVTYFEQNVGINGDEYFREFLLKFCSDSQSNLCLPTSCKKYWTDMKDEAPSDYFLKHTRMPTVQSNFP